MEREKFKEFCSPEGQQDLFDYCNRPRRTIVEVLSDFSQSACNIPLSHLLDMIPKIYPRYFSISSSPKECSNRLEILVAVVKYNTKMALLRSGLCSSWLADLPVHARVLMDVKTGNFKFPGVEDGVPVLMIGPGTGVAPFRSFILDRNLTNSLPNSAPYMELYYGGRNRQADYFYEDDWKPLISSNKLAVHLAFSRDQPHKIYVQDRLRENGMWIFSRIIGEEGVVLISGRSLRMPDDVVAVLADIISAYRPCSKEAAEIEVQKLKNSGRIQMETWS